MKKLFDRVVCIQSSPLETVTSIQSLLWGIWLILPIETFRSSSAYLVMAQVAPETAWGFLFLLAGLAQLYAVYRGGQRWRRALSTTMLFLWTFADMGFWLSGSASAASITYLTFVIVSAWSVIVLYKVDRT